MQELWIFLNLFLQGTYICKKHFPPDVVLDWKTNLTLEPYPANTNVPEPRKPPQNRNNVQQYVQQNVLQNIQQNVQLNGQNLVQKRRTYGQSNLGKQAVVKEVYVFPKELQG